MRCSVYIVYPSVLSCSNLELHQTLEVKNIFKQENLMLRIMFNHGLTLTGFRTTRPWGLNCNTFITLITRATFMPWRVTRRRRRSNRVVFNIWRSLVQVLLSPYRYLDFFLEVAGSYPRPRHETIQQVSLSPVEILHSFYSICNICSFICSVLNYRNCAKYI